MSSKEDLIRARAHEIWLKEGQPSGHEQRHWEQASREIESAGAKKAKPAAAKKPAAKKVAAPKKAAAKK